METVVPNRKRKREEEQNGSDQKKKKKDSDSKKKCPICYRRKTKFLMVRPEACKHIFCLRCLTKWSKKKNTCPLCRISFQSIVFQDSSSLAVSQKKNMPLGQNRQINIIQRMDILTNILTAFCYLFGSMFVDVNS